MCMVDLLAVSQTDCKLLSHCGHRVADGGVEDALSNVITGGPNRLNWRVVSEKSEAVNG